MAAAAQTQQTKTPMHQKDREKRLRELEDIVEQRLDWLFRFAYLRIGNREDAEDVVQDTLLKLYTSGQDLSHVDNVERYLLRSVSNACIDYQRRRRPTMVDISHATDRPEPPDADGNLHEEYMRISQVLDTLPPQQAETVRLHITDQLTFRQIATMQGVPESTVKARFQYAIKKLKENLSLLPKRSNPPLIPPKGE